MKNYLIEKQEKGGEIGEEEEKLLPQYLIYLLK